MPQNFSGGSTWISSSESAEACGEEDGFGGFGRKGTGEDGFWISGGAPDKGEGKQSGIPLLLDIFGAAFKKENLLGAVGATGFGAGAASCTALPLNWYSLRGGTRVLNGFGPIGMRPDCGWLRLERSGTASASSSSKQLPPPPSA